MSGIGDSVLLERPIDRVSGALSFGTNWLVTFVTAFALEARVLSRAGKTEKIGRY